MGWVNVSGTHDTELSLCKIARQEVLDCPPIVVSHSLIIKLDCSWMLHVHGHRVDPDLVPSLSKIPSCLDSETTVNLLQSVCSLNTCIGNPETKFTELGKSKKNCQFLSANGTVVAYVDSGHVLLNNAEEQFPCTVRCINCHLLTAAESKRCSVCTIYQNTLFSLCSRTGKKAVRHKTTNYR